MVGAGSANPTAVTQAIHHPAGPHRHGMVSRATKAYDEPFHLKTKAVSSVLPV